jgi:hypothetical protein
MIDLLRYPLHLHRRLDAAPMCRLPFPDENLFSLQVFEHLVRLDVAIFQ